MNIQQYLTLIITLSTLYSCKTTVSTGAYLNDRDLQNIEGKTKAELVETIGEPTIKEDDRWIYVSRTNTKRSWVQNKVTEQKVVRIVFEGESIKSVDVMNNAHVKIATCNDSITDGERHVSTIRNFIKNLGRFIKSNPRRY